MKLKYWVLIGLILFSLMAINANAAGVCVLDKEEYNSGETAVVVCGCSNPQEEGENGFMVWRNDTGTILQNTSLNTGSCRTTFFDDTLTFPNGFPLVGNVTFETSDPDWGQGDDIITDNFNVSLPGIFSCAINEIITQGGPTPGVMQIGEETGIAFTVTNGLSGAGLVNAQCMIQLVDVELISLVTRPLEGSPKDFRGTASGGRISFGHDLDEAFWATNTTYLVRANCHCINDSNVPGQACYNDQLGTNAGFQTCSAAGVFQTDFIDLRVADTNDRTGSLAVMLFVLFATSIFLILPFVIEKFSSQEWLDLLLKRLSVVLGLALMLMISGMTATIADVSGIGLQGSIFVFLRIFSIGVYLLIFYTVWKTFTDMIQLNKENGESLHND